MEELFQKLKDWGCDTDGAIDRFMEEKELYVSCLKTVADDEAFDALGEALAQGNQEEAFDKAHTLKGVLANLGLTPMYDITVQIVEPLRNAGISREDIGKLKQPYEELMAAVGKLKTLLGA